MTGTIRSNLTFAAVWLLVFVAACTTQYGIRNVAPAGYGYNNAIAQSNDQQLLLNLVRLRYRDSVVFMDIRGVTTQHQFTFGLSAETLLPFERLGDGSVLALPNIQQSETPTISYVPLQGIEFSKSLLAPISSDTIVLLASSGWSIERLLTCCVERLGVLSNAPSASGPTPQRLPDNSEFRAAANILRQLQRDERVFVEHEPSEDGSRSDTFLVIDAETSASCERLRELLSAPSCTMRFRLMQRRSQMKEGQLVAQTRSVLGALYALSHAVSVPPEHEAAGLVTTSVIESEYTTSWRAFLGEQFRVQVSGSEPSDAYVKIAYRDHWFWIDDSDLEAKTTFNLMAFLLTLQSAAGNGMSPLLTLGAGG